MRYNKQNGTQARALQIAKTNGYSLLHPFATMELSEEMIVTAELFLVKCVSKNTRLTNIDELWEEIYHNKSFKLDIEKHVANFSSVHLQIVAKIQIISKFLTFTRYDFCYFRKYFSVSRVFSLIYYVILKVATGFSLSKSFFRQTCASFHRKLRKIKLFPNKSGNLLKAISHVLFVFEPCS